MSYEGEQGIMTAIGMIASALDRSFGNGSDGSNYLGYVDKDGHQMTVTTALCEIASGLLAVADAIRELAESVHLEEKNEQTNKTGKGNC